jgi:DNA-binding NtrC family response regulator
VRATVPPLRERPEDILPIARTLMRSLEHDDTAELPEDFASMRKIVVDRFEEAYVPRVLARAENVISRAADYAGVSRPSLYRMLERLRLTDKS